MTNIVDLYEELSKLRDDSRKLGPKRRQDKIGQKKLLQTQQIYAKYEQLIEEVSDKLDKSEISLEDSKLVTSYCIKIEKIYSSIKGYFAENATMSSQDNFEIKTAVSLLPVMDGSEDVTNQLIDAIELYETMIKQDDVKILINFVLKTRLTQSAKLRLVGPYTTVKDLVDDMKSHLLTKKSATALQTRLMAARQGNRSIDKFGQELEDLFVRLTVTQAGTSTEAYKVLRPLNEKTAIQKFAEGLRNEKLSTVITARGFDTLKDAIQSAKDAEVSMTSSAPTNPGQLLYMRNRGHGSRKSFRGNGRREFPYQPKRQYSSTSAISARGVNQGRSRGTFRTKYPNYTRTRRQYNKNRTRQQINAVTGEQEETDNQRQFFL